MFFFDKTLTGQEVFVTPDYGLSDILNHEYPAKFFLSESLKRGELPIWNPKVATGFPQASTISGDFNPINLLIFYLFPMPLAFNLSLALIFLTTGIFTYLYCRIISLSKTSSLFAGSVFAFSGLMTTHIVHFIFLQTVSFFPLELYFVEKYLQKKSLQNLIFLSFAVGLQILAGFYQITLYSIIVILIYILWRIFSQKNNGTKTALLIMSAIVIGFLVGAIQLLPSLEFTQISTRHSGVDIKEIAAFPYPIKHLVTYFWPYLLGDPRNGTYSPYSQNWGLFWENTGYIGILPLVFAAVALYKGRKKYPLAKCFSIICLVSLILMLGQNSPTFFLYHLPPLSFFRVPARWIIFLTFSLTILGAFGFEILRKEFNQKWVMVILIISIFNVFIFSYFYNLRGPANVWLKEPQTVQFLKQDKQSFSTNQSSFRIFTYANYLPWNQKFLTQGWDQNPEQYLSFLEGLDPNWNVIWEINHVDSYANITTLRDQTIRAIIDQNIKIDATLENDGILVLADSFYPGWKATVDGKETEILAANINQQAVVVPKGSHTVTFNYQPKSFKIGAIISIITTLVLLCLLLYGKKRHYTSSKLLGIM